MFELKRNECSGHPETHNCNEWMIVDDAGQKFCTIYAEDKAIIITEALNNMQKPKEGVQYYFFHNAKEAQYLIGQEVQFSDDGENWMTDILTDIATKNKGWAFSNTSEWFPFIRTIDPVVCALKVKLRKRLAEIEAEAEKLRKELGE